MTEVFLKLLNMSISAGWIVLAVLFIRLVFKKSPKWVNVALWGLVGVRLLLPFSIESILSLMPSTNTVPRNIIQTAAPEINSGLNSLNQAVNPLISESLAPNAAESVNPMRIITSVALVVWVLGVAAMFIYTVISYIKIYSLVKDGEELSENIIRTDNIDTPFILGIINPKIYLPSFLSEADSRYVIAHEKAHQKRKDYIWKPLAFALLSIYWFNPILWVGYIFLCKDIEFACDEKVISLYGEEFKVPYSKVLIKCSIPRKAITSCPVAFGEINVKDRIVKILNYKKPSFWVVAVSIVLCAVMAVCFLTDPIKKGEDKPEKEAASSSAVTSSEDTSTKAEITVSEVTTSKEESSLPAEAKEQATNSKPVTSSEPIKIDPAQELAAKRKELFDKLSPTQSVEVRNQVVDWLLSDSKESKKKLYTDEEIAKMRAECDSYDIAPDLITVNLTEKASKELFFKEFTPADFPGIDCKALEASSMESERIAVLTGKSYFGDEWILDEFRLTNRNIIIYVNEQTNKNIIENMIKLQKMDIVEDVSFNVIQIGT